MLDVGWNELLLILVVALLVVGPKDLPRVMRVVGYWMRKMRDTASQFRTGLDEMVREAELDEYRREAEKRAFAIQPPPSAVVESAVPEAPAVKADEPRP